MSLSTLKSYFSQYIHVITVFPALLLFLFATELCLITQNSLTLRKICVSKYNATLCEKLVFENKSLENEVEVLSNEWNLWLTISFTIPAIISLLYLVSDADRKSNYKNFMLISLAGFIIYSLICTIASTQDTNTCMYLLLTAQILNGVFGGGSLAYITSCFSHVSVNDNSKTLDNKYSNRSIKFSILESAILFGRLLGSIISGFILSNRVNFINYQHSFLISLSIFAVLFVYKIILFYCMKNNNQLASVVNKNFSISHDQLTASNENDDDDASKALVIKRKSKKIFENFLNIIDIWKVLVKKRDNNIRFYFLMFLFIYFLTSLIALGVSSIDYLFLTKIPISLKQTDYGIFRGLNTFLKGIALLIILPILKNYFHVSDNRLFIVGLISDIANYIVFSIASSITKLIWLGPLAYMFANYYVVCLRSFISKLIEQEDIGNF